VIPVTLALALHVLVFGSLVVVLDFSERATPAMPLAITGTLVTDNAIVIPPKVEEVEEVAPPEPEPEPVPDTSEQDRLLAEEQKRLEDARIEQERLDRIQKQLDDRRRAEEAAERKRVADAEKERKRIEAERTREAEIERQRQENERLRAEAEAARQAELDAESGRLAAMQADAKAAYAFAIRQRVMSRWVQPPTATSGIECIVNIRQLPGGEVVDVSIGRCNGDAVVRRSIEAAVRQASPLPTPGDPSVFQRNIQLEFRPTAE
jgi:colicin import membrane protein